MKTVDFLLNFKAKTDAVTRATSQMEQNIDKVEKKASGFASTFKGMLGANLATTAITTALSDKGINIRMLNQGFSEINVIVGVEAKDFNTSIRAIYRAFVKE